MGSDRRRRRRILTIRLFDHEDAQVQLLADKLGVHRSELGRALIFRRMPELRRSCGRKHGRACTNSHAELVESYRLARHTAELALEELTSAYEGDVAHWKAKGGRLPTFRQWLRAQTVDEDDAYGPVGAGVGDPSHVDTEPYG